MVVVSAGEFMMGSPENEAGRNPNEGPQHKVTMRQPFAIAERWVSRAELETFANETGYVAGNECQVWKDGKLINETGRSFRSPGFTQDDGDPAVCVHLEDARAYARWLSKKTGKRYRLPSEAEWEYAIRAGSTTAFWWGSTITTAQANYNGNVAYAGGAKGAFRQRTQSAGLTPNPWNVYGAGNAAEWMGDCWNDNHQGAPDDGSARVSGLCNAHPVRGGSWASDPSALRSAARIVLPFNTRRNDIGFRVATTLAR